MRRTDAGTAGSYGVACEFWQVREGPGDTLVELVSPLDTDSAVSAQLDRDGAGPHHLAFRVDDLPGEQTRLRRAGFVPVDAEPCAGARPGMQVAFMYLPEPGGVLVELVRYAPADAAEEGGAGELRAAIAQELPGVRADLERLVRIPGGDFDAFHPADSDRCAAAVADLLAGCGMAVRTVREGGRPAVIGFRAGPPQAPTVLLYAHHDVQPPGDRANWHSDPFEPVERDGRLYGRGAADDKAGLMAHVAALRAFGDDLPVTVAVLVEGEEESGSATLPEVLSRHLADLDPQVVVIADSGNWDIGRPALTTSLRGIVNLLVEVRVLAGPVHSGTFGGPVPDALIALSRLIAGLHDDAGDVAVAGLVTRPAAELELTPERLRAEAGVLAGVQLLGTGRLAERMWSRPAITVLGIDAPPIAGSAHVLTDAAAARISVRLAPGDNPRDAFQMVRKHLLEHAPWGAAVEVTYDVGGEPCEIDARGPFFDAARDALRVAWDGTAPVDVGLGGSIPGIATFVGAYPGAAILITGVEDPATNAHGPNESLHLAEFGRACLAEALLLRNVADVRPAPGGIS
jgi:acetylornithine deacetylase/succinyl-diaminopimelate desuccinylase-like protein